MVLRKWVCLWVTKRSRRVWCVFQCAIDTWQPSVTKKNGGMFGRSPYEDVDRSCGVTLVADDVFEKSLLELGTADECEHTVAKRVGEVNSALETCGSRQNAGKLVILPNLRRTVENRKFSRRKQECQIKASHRFLGIVYRAMLSMGADIDQRIWAPKRAWRELYGMWWNKKVPYKIKRTLFRGAVCGASLTGLTALLLHDRDYLRLQRCLEKKAPRSHARHGLLGRTRPHKDSQLAPSVGKGGGWRLLHTSAVYKGSDGTRELPASPHVMHIFHVVGSAECTSNRTTHSLRAFDLHPEANGYAKRLLADRQSLAFVP